MGQWGSKTFEELVETDEGLLETPQRCRVLDLDPRSPTVGLDRTPITVAATPSSKPQQCAGDTLNDPRSPTIGIDRTPIYSTRPEITDEKTKALREQSATTRRLLENETETETEPEYECPSEAGTLLKDYTDKQEEEEEEEELSRKILRLPITPGLPNTPGMDTSQLELLGHADMSPYIESESYSKLTERGDSKTGINDCIAATKVALSEKEKVKITSKIPVSKKQSPPPPTKPDSISQRSPLAPRNIDMDTPKAIIQRKQVKKLVLQVKGQNCQSQALLASNPRNYQLSENKENM